MVLIEQVSEFEIDIERRANEHAVPKGAMSVEFPSRDERDLLMTLLERVAGVKSGVEEIRRDHSSGMREMRAELAGEIKELRLEIEVIKRGYWKMLGAAAAISAGLAIAARLFFH